MTIIFPTAVLAALYLLFLLWHHNWFKSPLTEKEIRRISVKGDYEDMDIREKENFMKFIQADDGKPFFMVNLMKFREKAIYPDGDFPDIQSGEDAAKLYNSSVIKELLIYL